MEANGPGMQAIYRSGKQKRSLIVRVTGGWCEGDRLIGRLEWVF